MKKYDDSLVTKLHEQVEIYVQDGIEHICKPVPDRIERNVLDPRIKQVIAKKKTVKQSSSGYSLFHIRNRPDKINYDISHEEISEAEKLIKIDKDHCIDVFIFKADDYDANLPITIYLHGGGFTAGNISLYRNEMKYLAETTKTVVIFPEYRLAPENPYPAPIDDCVGTLEWVRANHSKLGSVQDEVVMVGDSAGGNLINSCLVKTDFTGVKLVIELYPVIDNRIGQIEVHDQFSVSEDDQADVDARINKMKNSHEEELYLMDKVNAAAKIVNLQMIADFTKLPQMTIISSQYDLLKIASDDFILTAQKAGKKIKSIRYLGCDHGFFDLIGIAPQAEEVCLEIAAEIKELMK